MTYTLGDEIDFNVDFNKSGIWLTPSTDIQLKFKTDGWILFNLQQTGIYPIFLKIFFLSKKNYHNVKKKKCDKSLILANSILLNSNLVDIYI